MLCAPSSIQWYMDQNAGTSGFGGTSGSLSVFFYVCPPLVSPRPTGHSFRDIWVKLCRHITLGRENQLFQKFWGSDPLGEFFPQIFFQDFDLKIYGSHGPDPGKNKQETFLAPDSPGLGGVASKVLELRFLILAHVYTPQF